MWSCGSDEKDRKAGRTALEVSTMLISQYPVTGSWQCGIPQLRGRGARPWNGSNGDRIDHEIAHSKRPQKNHLPTVLWAMELLEEGHDG
jgi:hypothetical protein